MLSSKKDILHTFRLRDLVEPYQEDSYPPIQYCGVFENQTDFFARKFDS